MSQETNVRQLIINKLTDEEYEQAVKSADELYLTPDTGGGGGGGSGTVTSVRVQATSPVVSSQNTAQTTTLNTTISLANNYGDTKNPYASKTKNYVLAAPISTNGTPSFRALDKADIPLASETAVSGGTTTSLVTTGEKYIWNNKQNALTTQTAYSAKGSATKVPQITTNTLGQVTGITEVDITHPTELPSQTGNSGKFLTTDGSSVSWATVQSGGSALAFTNLSATNWVADNTYNDYYYKCVLTCNGVTSDMYAQVIFGPAQATSGDYASVCSTGTNSVTIYSKVSTAITVPTILVFGVNE